MSQKEKDRDWKKIGIGTSEETKDSKKKKKKDE